jgi:clan AA aspartic protease
MITGRVVNGINPTIPITVLGPDETQIDLSAIIDTGFTGALTLSKRQIDDLSLAPSGGCVAVLADGQAVESRVYRAMVRLDGTLTEVRVIEVPDAALIGMELLLGFRLRLDVVKDGEVVIERLPPDFAISAT